MTRAGVQVAIVREHADEDDGARHGEADAEYQPRCPLPAECMGHSHAEAGRNDALRDCARHGHAPDGNELLDVELQSDAEHQQDDADFGQLLGHVAIRHEPRRVRSDEQAGDEIADDRGEPGAMRGKAEHERRAKTAGQSQDQIEGVHPSIIVAGFRVQGSRFVVQGAADPESRARPTRDGFEP